MVVRGARCLARWVLCLADTTAQSAQPKRRRAWRKGARQLRCERPDLWCQAGMERHALAEGLSCGLHRIERLMRLQALKAHPRRRRLPPDLCERQATAVAANVLERSFDASAPNRKWIADFTYVWTAEGWLYVAAVIDLFSRRVVGWSMSAAEAKADVFDYIERFYNPKRRHSRIGYMSPMEFESQAGLA